MKTANVSETKNNLSALLRRVKRGESVTLLHRKRPIAVLEPVGKHEGTRQAWIEERVYAGVLSPGRPLDRKALKDLPWPQWKRGGPSLVDCVLADRGDG